MIHHDFGADWLKLINMNLGLNQQEVANTGGWTREIQGYIMEIEDYVHYILIWEKRMNNGHSST